MSDDSPGPDRPRKPSPPATLGQMAALVVGIFAGVSNAFAVANPLWLRASTALCALVLVVFLVFELRTRLVFHLAKRKQAGPPEQ